MENEYKVNNNVEQWIVWKQENKSAYLWLVNISMFCGFLFGLLISRYF